MLYNLDKAVTKDKLFQSFATFGDVNVIKAAQPRSSTYVIEFYDGDAPACAPANSCSQLVPCFVCRQISVSSATLGCSGEQVVRLVEDGWHAGHFVRR